MPPTSISPYSIIPFILMLSSIAVFPLAFPRFWEDNNKKLFVALVLSVPIFLYLFFTNLTGELYTTIVFDYIPFMVLLGSLFTVTGGIYLSGDIEAKSIINTLYLTIGAVLASFIGTTGAAMLLIRPIIQTNKERKYKEHTILFFIAIVANCGGLLTPLGDPPLFMMYLKGVPFTWFFNLIPFWILTNGILLLIYFLTDYYFYKKENITAIIKDEANIKPIKIEGTINIVWLIGIIISVAFLNENYFTFIKANEYYKFIREAAIISMAVLSILFTRSITRESNNFTWEPIKEVAYLFLGIFITMVPCLLYLEYNAKTLGINSPDQFYYFTGLLSSFLDNTPTALTFYSLALGLGENAKEMIVGIPVELLEAICVGAVFFGGMTYIGNGPNLMIKSVAEENNIKMPSFFGYMFKFSLLVLLPVYIIIQFIFI